MTEIPSDEGKLYLATVLDLFSRRLLAAPNSNHPAAQLACDAIMTATAPAEDTRRSAARCSTPTADRPTLQAISPDSAPG